MSFSHTPRQGQQPARNLDGTTPVPIIYLHHQWCRPAPRLVAYRHCATYIPLHFNISRCTTSTPVQAGSFKNKFRQGQSGIRTAICLCIWPGTRYYTRVFRVKFRVGHGANDRSLLFCIVSYRPFLLPQHVSQNTPSGLCEWMVGTWYDRKVPTAAGWTKKPVQHFAIHHKCYIQH